MMRRGGLTSVVLVRQRVAPPRLHAVECVQGLGLILHPRRRVSGYPAPSTTRLGASTEPEWLRPNKFEGETGQAKGVSPKNHDNKHRFIDRIRVRVKAGNGGHGCVAFFRDNRVTEGPPEGGDGGTGGSVVVKASAEEHNLGNVGGSVRAEGGRAGGSNMHGKAGDSYTITVPAGTVVKQLPLEKGVKKEAVILADLEKPGDTVVVARGGRGGKGNRHFKTSTHRSPRLAQDGEQGEEKMLELELKLLAQVGLVGFPNAGKSTMLNALSRARPKIANYAFTTLFPMLGVVEFDDYTRFTMADLPGIIDGAHENRGLGLAFLRHIERTKVLCYVLDFSGKGTDQAVEQYEALRYELECYQAGMTTRPSVIAANKVDLPFASNNFTYFKEYLRTRNQTLPVFAVSAATGQGLEELVVALRRQALPPDQSNPVSTLPLRSGR